jgi:hypothetical protein
MAPPPERLLEVRWLWRRIYTYALSLLNCAGVGAIVLRLNSSEALKWIALALIGANVIMATLYLAGATVTDWAKLAHAARHAGD